MIDTTLIDTLKALAHKEKLGKEFSRRIRVKGKIIDKGLTKNGNIKLVVQRGEDKYGFVIIKSHKERYALAEKLTEGSLVSVEGINKFRAVICTKLKRISRIDESGQTTLS